MEIVLYTLAVVVIVGIVFYASRRRADTTPMRMGGGTRFADLRPKRPGADRMGGGGR